MDLQLTLSTSHQQKLQEGKQFLDAGLLNAELRSAIQSAVSDDAETKTGIHRIETFINFEKIIVDLNQSKVHVPYRWEVHYGCSDQDFEDNTVLKGNATLDKTILTLHFFEMPEREDDI